MRKLIILSGVQESLGGMLISLSSLIEGFKYCGAAQYIQVLVLSGSLSHKYLTEAGHQDCLYIIDAATETQFLQQSLKWLNSQPKNYPLLLDNCLQRRFLKPLIIAALRLRLSGRPVYFFFHDLGLSYNPLGFWPRKLMFTLLAPQGICNSHFTASNIYQFVKQIRGIMYQPVDAKRFNSQPVKVSPPANLQPILESGSRLILTVARMSMMSTYNDKNLQILPQVVAHLKAKGYCYHSVIIGPDTSPNQYYSRTLLEMAKNLDVANQFTILPSTSVIEHYYQYADVVITLAPREPFGRVVVEAIACGVPVVGSNSGGINEILSNFAPEWTVSSNDPEAAAAGIIRVVENPNTSTLLARGQDWVRSNCNLESYAQQLMEITGITPANQLVEKI